MTSFHFSTNQRIGAALCVAAFMMIPLANVQAQNTVVFRAQNSTADHACNGHRSADRSISSSR